MLRRRGGKRRNKFPAIVIVAVGTLICLAYLSTEVLLVIIALLLIALGVWLLFFC